MAGYSAYWHSTLWELIVAVSFNDSQHDDSQAKFLLIKIIDDEMSHLLNR
jgi:hypothetical protein